MNIDLLRKESCTLEYCSLLSGKGIVQVVDLVTRPNLRGDAQDSGSCLDHVAIANCERFIQVKAFVVDSIFSDHYPVGISLTGNKAALSFISTESSNVPRRVFNDKGYEAFFERISGTDCHSVINANDANAGCCRGQTFL